MPTAQQVAEFLGRSDDNTAVAAAGESLPLVTAMARSYTRGGGWAPGRIEPFDDVAAVITTATARLMTNPSQVATDTTAGPFNQRLGAGFTGWTLAELFVLNRYRKRAM